MKLVLKLLFGAIFVWMVVMTIRTSLTVSLFDAIPGFGSNPWAVATLWDAYFGFLTFYIWVLYKERGLLARIVWFVLIMTLGNIAMSAYVFWQLQRLREDEPVEAALINRSK